MTGELKNLLFVSFPLSLFCPLTHALNHSYQAKQLSTSRHEALITLIKKKRLEQKVYQELEINFSNKCGHQDSIQSACTNNTESAGNHYKTLLPD